ncbi:DUF6417 family protein [Streptomyces sp. enrichment culture]|uniref:DUF6417 family protein n=1 Tax=Streptomyces sp. enrichment culture TaxID=1795815 RepID=UPI003F57C35F
MSVPADARAEGPSTPREQPGTHVRSRVEPRSVRCGWQRPGLGRAFPGATTSAHGGHRLHLSWEQMESVAYGLWLHALTGSAGEASRFACEYGISQRP